MITFFIIYCILLILTTLIFYPCFVVAGRADEYMEEYEFREKLKER